MRYSGSAKNCFLPALVLLVLSYSGGGKTAPSKPKSQCGYESCPSSKPGVLNVHIVPHTHDDVGWLKTVDQYYYGAANQYQWAGVQYILDAMVTELQRNPERRFIYVEMGFFTTWWKEQSQATKDIVHQLVEEGRLEFINGGWCMNDEATPHYNDIIDQMTWGLRFLNDTFGECGRPRIAWQIDPFGHSREQASLFAQMSFDAQFFARLDWEDKGRRAQDKEMEMVWHGSDSLGEAGSLFSGALYNHYSPPDGFCFDVLCSDDPIIDNPKLADYNVPYKMNLLLNFVQRQAERFKTNNIMLTMGNDFNYMSGIMWFKNLDKMIKYANEMYPEINLFYSTPSCYVKALNEADIEWPTKTDDFFPYSNDPHAYWTGYFTSRPAHKGMIRMGNTILQTCKQLHSLSGRDGEDQQRIDRLREYMAESQHHDAVAGTEKQHVAFDYAQRLDSGFYGCQEDVAGSLNILLENEASAVYGDPPHEFCLQLNVSQCHVSETANTFVVTAYNPKAQPVSQYLRLPVIEGPYTVTDPDGQQVATQLVPIAGFIKSLKERISIATHELVFRAVDLPPLGLKRYHVTRTGSTKKKIQVRRPHRAEKVTISNTQISVSFNENGLMESVSQSGVVTPLQQNLMWYRGMKGYNQGFDDRASGAYIFRPNGTDAQPIASSATIRIVEGELVNEVHQTFSDWAGQVVRLYKEENRVEIQWTVGPIPINDGVGKEIINRVVTTMKTDGVFFTDANGRQTLERRRDYRPTWTLNPTEPVAENYYPINSHIYVKGDQLVGLVNDRSQGGTSLHDGEIELMIHRRLLYDDAFGVGEALNEPGDTYGGLGLVVTGTHLLIMSQTEDPMSVIRPMAQTFFMPPWLTFGATELTTQQFAAFINTKSGLSVPLPPNVHLLTLEPWRDGTHLLRLEHVYGVGESPTLSMPVTVQLDNLLDNFTITSAEETTLAANQWKKDASRFKWKTLGQDEVRPWRSSRISADQSGRISVELQPMEIRTFVVTLEPKL